MVASFCRAWLIRVPLACFHLPLYILELGHNCSIVLSLVRDCAVGAVLHAVVQVRKVSAALPAQHVQGAVAEDAVEIVQVFHRVARKGLTFSVAEEHVFFALGFCHSAPPFAPRSMDCWAQSNTNSNSKLCSRLHQVSETAAP